MKITSGIDSVDSQHGNSLVTGEGKGGKTFFLVSSLLGLLPWQEHGGVVDKPSHLHVIGTDYGAITGVKASLKKLLGATDEALSFRYYSLQDDYKAIFNSPAGWDYAFYNACLQAFQAVRDAVMKAPQGVHAMLISSVTTMVAGLERGIAGAPSKKGMGMDESKWQALYQQVNELRNIAQADDWHTIWEAHIDRQAQGVRDGGADAKEVLQIRGRAGRDFPNNVEQIFRLRRSFGSTFGKTNVDEMYLDTRPTMEFIAGGRGFTENLKEKEPCLTVVYDKLGLRVGQWTPSKSSKKGSK